ncbi:hypothetical protein HanIR_Chr04g0161931 [Helianthus annuus]|nr:hypothetical protein HanIR_Chr04g0161931 [Helianthus annuus]
MASFDSSRVEISRVKPTASDDTNPPISEYHPHTSDNTYLGGPAAAKPVYAINPIESCKIVYTTVDSRHSLHGFEIPTLDYQLMLRFHLGMHMGMSIYLTNRCRLTLLRLVQHPQIQNNLNCSSFGLRLKERLWLLYILHPMAPHIGYLKLMLNTDLKLQSIRLVTKGIMLTVIDVYTL